MQADLTMYAKFYKEKHQGHKLYWDHQLGTATLKARFNGGQKDLSVSLYQAVVLLLFNDSDKISFKEIQEQTRMSVSQDVEKDDKWAQDDAELRRTLQSLACGKKKVLRKIPEGREVGDDDVFRFNADFTDPHARVHINSIQAKDTVRRYFPCTLSESYGTDRVLETAGGNETH
jgi:cullin 4